MIIFPCFRDKNNLSMLLCSWNMTISNASSKNSAKYGCKNLNVFLVKRGKNVIYTRGFKDIIVQNTLSYMITFLAIVHVSFPQLIIGIPSNICWAFSAWLNFVYIYIYICIIWYKNSKYKFQKKLFLYYIFCNFCMCRMPHIKQEVCWYVFFILLIECSPFF